MLIHPLVFKLHKALRASLRQGEHYLLAVSGGSDSMALAAACAALQRDGWGRFSVCHVEHGLRGEESLRDMALVQRFCAEQQLPCYVQQVDVHGLVASEGLSIEAAARQLRHEVLGRVLLESEAKAVVFAHNRDDQAETMLLRLLRGTSLKGLRGIMPESDMGLHPLLGFSHRELAEYCRLQGVHYAKDSTNDDLAYSRNRVRHEILPYLEKHFNSNIKLTLARMAEQLRYDDEYLECQAMAAYAEAKNVPKSPGLPELPMNEHMDFLQGSKPYELVFSATKLQALEPALRRRVLREGYRSLALAELDYERTLALERLVLQRAGGKLVQLPQNVIAIYKNKQLIIKKQ